MTKYLIERQVPDAGSMSREALQLMAQQSVRALRKLGPEIQWVSSAIAADTIYCTYIADSEALLREHARAAGLPIDRISVVHSLIDPATAESAS